MQCCGVMCLGCTFLSQETIDVLLLHQIALAHLRNPYFVTLCSGTLRLEDMNKWVFFFLLVVLVFYCVYIFVCVQALPTCVSSTQVKLRSVFSPATRWVPGIKHQVNTPGIFYLHPSWLSRSCGLCLPIGFLPHGGHSAFRYWGREEGSGQDLITEPFL